MTKPIVSLSFDDGWKSAIQNAFPLLQKFEVPATFYIISNCLDDEKFPQYMNMADLKTLERHGHEIGSHTRSHQHLPDLSEKDIWEEIAGGLEDLCSHGFSSRTFAYPYGEWNPHIVKQVREAGFFAARSIERGTNDKKTNPFLLRANGVREEHSAEQIISLVDDTAQKEGWTILYFHQIEKAEMLRQNKWIYGTTPEVLEKILYHIRNQNLRVMTIADGMSQLVKYALY